MAQKKAAQEGGDAAAQAATATVGTVSVTSTGVKVVAMSASIFGEEFSSSDGNDVLVTGMDIAPGDSRESFIPKVNPEYKFRRDKLREVLNFFLLSWQEGPSLGLHLKGPTGSGKTSLIEQVCARLRVPLVSYTCHERTEVQDLISSVVAVNGSTLTVDGPLTMAMRSGMPFIANEIDAPAPGTLIGLNDIIERGMVVIPESGEVVKAEPGFVFVATSNTGGQGDDLGVHAGTQIGNIAFWDRFVTTLVGYMDPAEEIDLLQKANPTLKKEACKIFIDTANLVREAFVKGSGLSCPFSTRKVIQWMKLTGVYRGMASKGISPPHLALDLVLGNNLSEGERVTLHKIFEQVSGVPEKPEVQAAAA